MPVEIVTRADVPILRVGTFPLSTGEHTFTEEDLKAAADALATDPAIKAPRAKIDSVEKALGLDPATHGGEPAFGYFDNLHVTGDGQELLADYHGPRAVVEAMEWAYPSLSVEGGPHTSATGRTHDLVISAVALLGIHWPGVTTLDDFTEFLAEGPKIEKTENAPDEVLAVVAARAAPIAASLDQETVRQRLYEAIDGGDLDLPDGVKGYSLWIRSLRFDDAGKPYAKVTDEDTGRLYRVDFAVKGSEVTFSEFVEIVEQDVPVAAAARPLAPIAVWATREQSRALASQQPTNTEDSDTMTDEQRRALAPKYGLDPDTATEAEVIAAAIAAPDPAAEATPPAAKTPEIPEGFSIVDDATLNELREGAGLAVAASRREQRADRDATISAAITAGKIPPARREAFEAMWGDPTSDDPAKRIGDPEGARQLLAKLAPGLVPVDEREVGIAGDGDVAEDDGGGTGLFPELDRVEA
jgi:hypothetical protein